jgi:hypothetical protein
MYYNKYLIYEKTDSSRTTTGRGRVGLNRLFDQTEPHTTGWVRFGPTFQKFKFK